ncbi:hypothetical protein CKAH01_00253 [Colletotrichum kahawae]|uniref:Uncharacterized protein n=1 Tax=Colletotrichum kahawae TaxID=34407 RepID=A0AAD9YZ16_COLKA|nr:hypothetical protein CKAH01_00253 [Colletotrichum kahawae]
MVIATTRSPTTLRTFGRNFASLQSRTSIDAPMPSRANWWLQHHRPTALHTSRNPTPPIALHTMGTRVPRLQQHDNFPAARPFTMTHLLQPRSALPAASPFSTAQSLRQRYNFPAAGPVTDARSLRRRCQISGRRLARNPQHLQRRRARMALTPNTRPTRSNNHGRRETAPEPTTETPPEEPLLYRLISYSVVLSIFTLVAYLWISGDASSFRHAEGNIIEIFQAKVNQANIIVSSASLTWNFDFAADVFFTQFHVGHDIYVYAHNTQAGGNSPGQVHLSSSGVFMLRGRPAAKKGRRTSRKKNAPLPT